MNWDGIFIFYLKWKANKRNNFEIYYNIKLSQIY